MNNKASNTLISKSVQNRLKINTKEERTELENLYMSVNEELKIAREKLEMAMIMIESNDRRHEEDMGYIQHYRIRIAELEKALKDNNIEVP